MASKNMPTVEISALTERFLPHTAEKCSGRK